MRPIQIVRALTAADDDGIALAQQTVGAADLTLNGPFVTAGVAQLDEQRKVGITSVGDLHAVTFTVYGTDQTGNSISESLAGPNNGTVSTTLDFYTVTRVAVDGAVGTDVIVGTTGVGALQPIPLDIYLDPFNATLNCVASGTVNYTAQYTFDNVFSGAGPFNWVNHGDLTAKTSTATGTLISPVTAVRLVTNSGTGTITFNVIQAGVMG